MASPPLLNIEDLLHPIPGPNPAGSDVRGVLEMNLDPLFREDNEAAWQKIIEISRKELKETSKDPQIAVWLTRGLVSQNSFPGLRDGLRLLRELVEKCWDFLYPPLVEGDKEATDFALELRSGVFGSLDDEGYYPFFPGTLRALTLFQVPEGPALGLDDCKKCQTRKTLTDEQLQQPNRLPTAAEFQALIQKEPLSRLDQKVADLTEALEEVTRLSQLLSEKYGPSAPLMLHVRQAIKDNLDFLETILLQRRPGGAPEKDKAGDEATPQEGGTHSAGRVAQSRSEAYQQLAQAAQLLLQLEPHSPIPYLVQKAVKLEALSFPQLLQEPLIALLIQQPHILGDGTSPPSPSS